MTKAARPTPIKSFHGILIIDSRDGQRNPTQLKLCAKVETDYMLSPESLKVGHQKFVGKSVVVKGEVDVVDGKNVLTVIEIEEEVEEA